MTKELLVVVLSIYSLTALSQTLVTVSGPDTRLRVTITLQGGSPYYSIDYNNEVYLDPSPLGLKTSIGDFSKGLSWVSHAFRDIQESYDLTKSKVNHVEYRANELTCRFINSNTDTLYIIFRVSKSDLAFSYRIKTKERKTNLLVYEEATGFDLPDHATAFITPQALPMSGWERTKPSYEEEYTCNEALGTSSKYGVGYTFPALFKLSDKGWVFISETGVDSRYVGSRLGEGTDSGFYPLKFPQAGENNSIGGTYAAMALPVQTPWRTVTVGNTLKPIVESTVAFDVVKPLYAPSREYQMGKATWSWIVWQDGSINYEDQVKFIDLAAYLNFEYVLIDNWWDRNIGHERMETLVAYANSKNVDVILWYNSNGFWNDAPQTPQDKMNTSPERKKEMAWLKSIGVKGLKVDFFGGDKQETMKLYEDILSDANEYGLAIIFHGCTLPRGWERMYPNFMTSEAVLASENLVFRQSAADAHAYNATILPFTRNAVGAMDFAPVFFNSKLTRDQKSGSVRRTTDVFEIATSVLYQSPIQHFGITPDNLNEVDEFVWDFIRNVPTTWDEIVFIDGYPGKHIALARRKGEKWYIAVVNGEPQQKELEIYLPMMMDQEVILLYDQKDRHAGIKKIKINKNGKIKLALLPEGGAMIYNI